MSVVTGGPAGTTISAAAVPISRLVTMIQQAAGGAITDRTGLEGLFDFKLQYSSIGSGTIQTPFGPIPNPATANAGAAGPGLPSPSATAGDTQPSLFTAIQEQLGLRLESRKGSVQILVIDSVERPAVN
jgi:uncharacterized protein (TIGR03435 family)